MDEISEIEIDSDITINNIENEDNQYSDVVINTPKEKDKKIFSKTIKIEPSKYNETINANISRFFKLKNMYKLNKKKLYSSKQKKPILKPDCVNCKRPVGSIFEIIYDKNTNYRYYIAKCADPINPCRFNIKIQIPLTSLCSDKINQYKNELDNFKKEIILNKNNLLFGYIEDNQAIELFTKEKNNISQMTKILNNYLDYYDTMINSPIKKEQNEALKEEIYNTDIFKIKQLLKQYNEENDSKWIKEAIDIYKNILMPKLKELNKNEYAEQYTLRINDDYYFIQVENKYSIKKLEISEGSPTVLNFEYNPSKNVKVQRAKTIKKTLLSPKNVTLKNMAGEELEQEEQKEEDEAMDKVAIIVPFRDLDKNNYRTNQLKRFIPYMSDFLDKSTKTKYCIYIIEQSNDGRKFNRGKLLNIGYEIAKQDGCNIFIFHDVDLLPSENLLDSYTTMPNPQNPVHIAKLWTRYSGDAYFGGIVVFTAKQFEDINGFPNNFWGWGGEDDELRKRINELKFSPVAPKVGSITDLEEMNLTQKLGFLKSNPDLKCNIKRELLDEHQQTWKTNGLNTLDYQVISITTFMNENCKKVLVDVKLNKTDNLKSNEYSGVKCYEEIEENSKPNINNGEVTWNNKIYQDIWDDLNEKYKTALISDINWLQKTMDEFVKSQRSGKKKTFIPPDNLVVPPCNKPDGKVDFGNDTYNNIFESLTNDIERKAILGLKSDVAEVSDYELIKNTLNNMVSKKLGFES
jgi:hypothetical protein